jgi:hypothetical protein
MPPVPPQTSRRPWGLFAVLCCLGGWLALPPAPARAAEAEPLDRALAAQAGRIKEYLKANNVRNVGVLKFMVKKDGKPASASVGPLNMLLANRLEIALVLADDPAAPYGVIQRASKVASEIDGANHLTAEGRKQLFGRKYPLAWGSEEVEADAFLTGKAEINADGRTMTVTVAAIRRDGARVEQVVEPFTALVTPATRAEIGESFLRGLTFKNVGGQAQPATPAAYDPQAPDYGPKTAADVYTYDKTPVALEIYYDGILITPRKDSHGGLVIPEPKGHQRVHFVLRRKDAGPDTYGVVLKVNGESTLFREKGPDFGCLKWLLPPGAGVRTIKGFQVTDDNSVPFVIKAAHELGPERMNYGEDLGTISCTVYRNASGKYAAAPKGVPPAGPPLKGEGLPAGEPPAPPDELGDSLLRSATVVAAGEYPKAKTRPKTLKELQYLLRLSAKKDSLSKGFIVIGEGSEAHQIERLPFTPEPEPVMSLVIRYADLKP